MQRPNTLIIFGEDFSVTSKGRMRATTCAALLRRRTNLRCTLKSEFDAMTDGHSARDKQVSAPWVIETLLTKPSSTLHIMTSTRLGAKYLSIGNACYDVDVTDGEFERRSSLASTLPAMPNNSGFVFSSGKRLTGASIEAARRRFLDSEKDPIAFDEAIESLRVFTEADELAVFLNRRGHLYLPEEHASTGGAR